MQKSNDIVEWQVIKYKHDITKANRNIEKYVYMLRD